MYNLMILVKSMSHAQAFNRSVTLHMIIDFPLGHSVLPNHLAKGYLL